jgi:hypothetical protein
VGEVSIFRWIGRREPNDWEFTRRLNIETSAHHAVGVEGRQTGYWCTLGSRSEEVDILSIPLELENNWSPPSMEYKVPREEN